MLQRDPGTSSPWKRNWVRRQRKKTLASANSPRLSSVPRGVGLAGCHLWWQWSLLLLLFEVLGTQLEVSWKLYPQLYESKLTLWKYKLINLCTWSDKTSWNKHLAATPHLGVSHTRRPSLGVSLLYLGWRHRDKPLSLTLSLEPGLEFQKNKTSKGRSATTSTGAEGKPTKVKIHPGAEVTILQKLCWPLQVLTGAGTSSDHLGEPETDFGQDFLTIQTSCHLPQFFLCLSLILMSVPLNTDRGVTRPLYFHCDQLNISLCFSPLLNGTGGQSKLGGTTGA